MEHEQLLLLSYSPVISLLGFFDKLLVLCELLAVRERDTIQSLQGIVLSVCKEVRRRVLRKHRMSQCVPNRKVNGRIYLTLVIAIALIRPVCGTCGPRQKSIKGPHRYTVDEVPSGTWF
jgi:hypothetical protein